MAGELNPWSSNPAAAVPGRAQQNERGWRDWGPSVGVRNQKYIDAGLLNKPDKDNWRDHNTKPQRINATGSLSLTMDMWADGVKISTGTGGLALTVGVYADWDWYPVTPVTTSFSTAGSHTYNINTDDRYIDISCLGGGAGGGHGHSGWDHGAGGNAGSWSSVRLERGVDIDWTVTSLDVYVGDGGLDGPTPIAGSTNGESGEDSYVNNGGTRLVTGDGGDGGGIVSQDQTGHGASDHSFQGQNWSGSNDVGKETTGDGPGGGGGGGDGKLLGGDDGASGAAGIVHIRSS